MFEENHILFDHKMNQDIMKELKTQPALENINNYKHKWIWHVLRMDRSSLPYTIMKYQPAGKRNPGCPFKSLLDCYIETGTGHDM
jgi:hypothetical protein